MRPTLVSRVWAAFVAPAALVTLAAACGGAPPPPPAEPAHAEEPVHHDSRPALKTRSELGSIDPGAR